ncbi:MAG TPA: PQQ-dependent sugar dehydrogenase [Fimbriimonadaceae bacterium]|nr:PQQ-dependent sugar dehydrogenase [Fimbriimonadaceae bacterium]
MRKVLLAGLLAAVSAAHGQIRYSTYVTGLSQPVAMTQDPGQPNVQYVVQRTGLIRVIQNGTLLSTPFIDLSSLVITSYVEEGLLGLALPPDYATSGYAYVYYTNTSQDIQIVRYSRSTSNPLTLDSSSAYPILTIPHPVDQNHNGGTLRFGPDGYLYAGVGDGGSGNDPHQHGQDPNTLLAKMIRIDPTGDDFPDDPTRNYHIPASNPFVDGNPITAMGEIWDLGLRNPWKWSFDSPALGGTGALIIGDVGQDAYEEVDFEQPGTGGFNYGWRLREGMHDTGLGGSQAFAPLTDPIAEYAHYGANGNAITGGYVYRGTALGNYWNGRYFYADEVTGDVWSFRLNQSGTGSASDNTLHTDELGTAAGHISSIDVDSAGELYFLNFNAGRIYKVISSAVPPTSVTVYQGDLVSGDLGSLIQSDDQRLVVNGHFGIVASVSPINVRLDAVAPAQTATSLRFFLEAQSSSNRLQQVVELWDYTAGAWVQIDSRPSTSNNDSRIVLTVTNPNRFIENGTRAMRAQIRYYATGVIPFLPWTARIDQAVWGFYP